MNIAKEFLFRTIAWVMVASAIYFYEVNKLGPMLSLGIGAFAMFVVDFKMMRSKPDETVDEFARLRLLGFASVLSVVVILVVILVQKYLIT